MKQAPEIFQRRIDELDLNSYVAKRGSPEFEQELITRYALDYAARGWNALVTVDTCRGACSPGVS